MRRWLLLLALTVVGASCAIAQEQKEEQKFEVAIIKRLPQIPENEIKAGIEQSPVQVRIHGVTMSWIIDWAFGIQRYQLVAPEWTGWRSPNDKPRFEFAAKFSPETTTSQVREMTQKLLVEKAKLQTHFETRPMNAYTVQVGLGGFKAHPSDPGEDMMVVADRQIDVRHMEIIFRALTLREILDGLSLFIGVPIVDLTDLDKEQHYSLRHTVVYEGQRDMTPVVMDFLKNGLGFTVTKQKNGPVKVLVVDSVSDNPIVE